MKIVIVKHIRYFITKYLDLVIAYLVWKIRCTTPEVQRCHVGRHVRFKKNPRHACITRLPFSHLQPRDVYAALDNRWLYIFLNNNNCSAFQAY